MAEENKKPKMEEKKMEKKQETKAAESKANVASENVKPVESKEEKKEEKKETKKTETPKVKKTEAIAYGISLVASKKHCMYICNFIKGKKIDDAISMLQDVIKYKRAVPFKGEIPHRRGVGMMSGRYPINASKIFINILKGLKGNAIVNGMDLDRTFISYGSPSWASRPSRKGGVSAKRTNLLIKAKEIPIKPESAKKQEAKK